MRAKVTENGLLIPKELLDGVDEVKIRKTDNLGVIVLTTRDETNIKESKPDTEPLPLGQINRPFLKVDSRILTASDPQLKMTHLMCRFLSP